MQHSFEQQVEFSSQLWPGLWHLAKAIPMRLNPRAPPRAAPMALRAWRREAAMARALVSSSNVDGSISVHSFHGKRVARPGPGQWFHTDDVQRISEGSSAHVQWVGRGECASRTHSPLAVGLLVGREHQWRSRLHQITSRYVLNEQPSKEQDTKIEIHTSTIKSNLLCRRCQALLKALHTCGELSTS
jgi:hypothetical protein